MGAVFSMGDMIIFYGGGACYTVKCNNLGHDIKRHGKYLFSIKFISVGKAYLRKADACNNNKKQISQQYIISNFLKSN